MHASFRTTNLEAGLGFGAVYLGSNLNSVAVELSWGTYKAPDTVQPHIWGPP